MPASRAVILAGLAGFAALGCGYARQRREREEYLIAHPNMPKNIKTAIANKSIVRGMTKGDVRVCWGKPHRIEKVGETTEAWIYRRRVAGPGSHAQVRTYRIVFIRGRVATFVELSRTR